MEYLYDLYTSFRAQPTVEREEALRNVRRITTRDTRRARRDIVRDRPVPQDDPISPAPSVETPIAEAFRQGTQEELSPVPPDAFVLRRRRSLDSMSTGVFDEVHSTPGSRVGRFTLNSSIPATPGPNATLNHNTAPFTSGSTGAPTEVTPEDTQPKRVVEPTVDDSVVGTGPDDASNLPLDPEILSGWATIGLDTKLKQLKLAREELSDVKRKTDEFFSAVETREAALRDLKAELSTHKQAVEKLVHQRCVGEQEIANLDSLNKNLGAQVLTARAELDNIKLAADKVKLIPTATQGRSDVLPPVSVPTVSAVPTPVTLVTDGRQSASAPPWDGSYLGTPGSGRSIGSVCTPVQDTQTGGKSFNMVQTPTTTQLPVPMPRSRSGFTPTQKARYENNPAIARLGIDIIPRDHDDLDTIDSLNLNFGDVKHPDAARQKAIDVPTFTGTPPWRKYKIRFKGIIDSNRWNNQQALVALKQALFGGPGEPALAAFEQVKDKTLDSLFEIADWAIGKIGEHDPRTQLLKRVQKKDEHLRSYGFALQELITECYRGCRPDTPTVIQELTSRFVIGVRDTQMQAYLREKWQPDLSLADLFNHADVFDTKQAVFPGIGVASIPTVVPTVEAASVKETKKQPASKKVAAVATETDIDKMFDAYMKKHMDKAKSYSNSGSAKKKKKKVTTPQPCRRCQKLGHWASECKAPAPISAKPEKETGN